MDLPGPALVLPVDVDGDGVPSFGDLYFFNWWLEQGGSLEKALSSAKANGRFVDLSEFFAGRDAQLESSATLMGGAAAQGGGGCVPPPDQPNHTRRIPPSIEPLGAPTSEARITPNARFIVFSSAASNLPGANGFRQIYRFEQGATSTGGALVHVSKSTTGASAAAHCFMPSISNNGSLVVFHTTAVLDPAEAGDTFMDVYLRDLTNPQSPVTVLLTGERVFGDPGHSFGAAISGGATSNGTTRSGFVAFTSAATDLVNPDVNGSTLDVFRLDLSNNGIVIASLRNDDPFSASFLAAFSTIGDDPSLCPAAVSGLGVGRVISDDGSRILMHGAPCDWIDTSLCPDPDLDCFDCNPIQQVYLRDIPAGGTPRTFVVSRRFIFDPFGCDGVSPGNLCSRRGSISADGSRIAFSSRATNFRDTGLDTDAFEDVFFIDTADVIAGTCVHPTRVSVVSCGGGPINGHSFQPVLSRDGVQIAFASHANNLLPVCNDTNGARDVFIRDLSAAPAVTRRFSVSSSGVQGNGNSSNPDVSGDGRIAVYESLASTLLGPNGDMNGQQDVFETPSPQGPFIRGDVDLNGVINITDSIYIFNWLFQGGPAPPCHDAADADDNGAIEQADGTRINSFLFQGGPPPPCPFSCTPATSCCGKDPTGDGLPCGQVLVGCTHFAGDGSCSRCP